MNKFDVLAKKYYDNAFEIVSEISRQLKSDDDFVDQAFLMAFDLTFQFSLVELLNFEQEAQPKEAKLVSKTANSTNLADFLKLIENIDFDFENSVDPEKIQPVLMPFFTLFFDCLTQADQTQKSKLQENLTLCFASLLHIDSPLQEDIKSLPKLKVLEF